MPDVFDHLVVFIIAIAYPIHAAFSFPKFRVRAARGAPRVRIDAYRQVVVVQWAFTLVVLGAWWWRGRPAEWIGLTHPDSRGMLIGVLAIGALWVFQERQHALVLRTQEGFESCLKQIRPIQAILPHTIEERRLFMGVSVTAGICEEIIARGFLIWYFSQIMPLVPAALVATVVFGFAHLYQGWEGVLKTAIVGGVFATLYLVTGSLLASIVAHALVDISAGVLSHAVISTPFYRRPTNSPLQMHLPSA